MILSHENCQKQKLKEIKLKLTKEIHRPYVLKIKK